MPFDRPSETERTAQRLRAQLALLGSRRRNIHAEACSPDHSACGTPCRCWCHLPDAQLHTGEATDAEKRAVLARHGLTQDTWRVWICPMCGDVMTRRGVDAHCAGSHTERTHHESVPMVPANVTLATCPECGLPAVETGDEVEHMQRMHPDVIARRLSDAGMHHEAARFRGA